MCAPNEHEHPCNMVSTPALVLLSQGLHLVSDHVLKLEMLRLFNDVNSDKWDPEDVQRFASFAVEQGEILRGFDNDGCVISQVELERWQHQEEKATRPAPLLSTW